MFLPGSQIKFKLKYSPFLTGTGTIQSIYASADLPCVYSVEIEEVEGHYIYVAGEVIFILPQEIEKEVYFA